MCFRALLLVLNIVFIFVMGFSMLADNPELVSVSFGICFILLFINMVLFLLDNL